MGYKDGKRQELLSEVHIVVMHYTVYTFL